MVYPGAVLSPDGQWVASPAEPPAAAGAIVQNIQTGDTTQIALSSGFSLYGMAFDTTAARLALMELSGPGDDQAWAVLVADPVTGEVARFDGGSYGPEGQMLPGSPIGWSASGTWLLIDTFIPFSDAGAQGVWAFQLPPGTPAGPLEALLSYPVIPASDYIRQPRLSPNASRLLYLGRDWDYTPEGYEPIAWDMAVNQAWTVAVGETQSDPQLWVSLSDGSALGPVTDWLPSGQQIVLAQGTYDGDAFPTLTLRRHDGTGFTGDLGTIRLPKAGYLIDLRACTAEQLLITVGDTEGLQTLSLFEITSGNLTRIVQAETVSVVGCTQ
jgi:hypothetical protein